MDFDCSRTMAEICHKREKDFVSRNVDVKLCTFFTFIISRLFPVN